ncbi:hypothetical protein EZ456_07390 [Pedobacter psychrodurus]|uniref:Uncharacterized protein n=1 Tax=Pedobacter psychrodurus TaxID=2530456 RepID=A0A4R0PXU0_9SPHI|nr:hypothetical protein [Pedobacter psychrodurus]TCD27764.1 hypothetical protein EZ456_07390 [Pedobacter psychrodurus]
MNEIYKIITTSLTTSAIVLGAAALLKEYLFAYSGEKAKNLAQKEDIEELTDKVQKIISIYVQQNNALEQKISQMYSFQNTHRIEERTAIIEFYESYVHWMYTILEIPIDYYNQSNLHILAEKKKELDEYFLLVNKASAKFILLVKNTDLMDLHTTMIVELINFKGWTDAKLLNLQFDMERWNTITEKFSQLIKNLDKNREEAKLVSEEETGLMERLNSNRISYKMGKVKEFHKCREQAHSFAQKAKDYLTSIN